MKRIICTVLIALMVLSFTACLTEKKETAGAPTETADGKHIHTFTDWELIDERTIQRTCTGCGKVESSYVEGQTISSISDSTDYAGAKKISDYSFVWAIGTNSTNTILKASFVMAIKKGDSFFDERDASGKRMRYDIILEGEDFYRVTDSQGDVFFAVKALLYPNDVNTSLSYSVQLNSFRAFYSGESSFNTEEGTFSVSADGVVTKSGREIGYISRYSIMPVDSGTVLTKSFRKEVETQIESFNENFEYDEAGHKSITFEHTEEEGKTSTYRIIYEENTDSYVIKKLSIVRYEWK